MTLFEKRTILCVLCLFCFLDASTQETNYKYLYITTNSNIDTVGLYVDSTEAYALEPHLFKFKSNETITIKINNTAFNINLSQFKYAGKFIELTVRVNPLAKSDDYIMIIDRGDVIVEDRSNCRSDIYHTINVKYPRVVVINGEITVTINPIFFKYVFD